MTQHHHDNNFQSWSQRMLWCVTCTTLMTRQRNDHAGHGWQNMPLILQVDALGTRDRLLQYQVKLAASWGPGTGNFFCGALRDRDNTGASVIARASASLNGVERGKVSCSVAGQLPSWRDKGRGVLRQVLSAASKPWATRTDSGLSPVVKRASRSG